MPNILDHHLTQAFQDKPTFTKEDLREFYRKFDPELKESTLKWRVYDLKKSSIIREIKRGLYTTHMLPIFEPQISGDLHHALKITGQFFTETPFCGWETSWLNAYSRHQGSQNIIILEIEKDLMESLYYEVKSVLKIPTYLNPSKEVIKYQIAEDDQSIVIQKLVTRSPIRSYTYEDFTYPIPTIEKVMVDLLCDDDLLYTYQGTEMLHIWEKMLGRNDFDFSQMLTYAKRREKGSQIRNLLVQQIPHLVKDILDAD